MKTILYITAAKAMQLVYDDCNGNIILYAKAFKAIRDEGFQYTLPNGCILMKSISSKDELRGKTRYVIVAAD